MASYDKARGDLTVYITSQAPHVVRTVVGLLSAIPESKIRIISPDIGGGFGNKVGVYPGYVASIVASIVLGRPVKWIESRAENPSTTAFAPRLSHEGRTRRGQRRTHQGICACMSSRIMAPSTRAPNPAK
ncbi:molybdopterin cofactor-binding domain-containing protein [Cupriavidus basilensis]